MPIEPLVDAYWLFFVRVIRLTAEEAEEVQGCYRSLHSLVLTAHKAEREVTIVTHCTASPSFNVTAVLLSHKNLFFRTFQKCWWFILLMSTS